jgi:hypothetical protein
VDLRDGEFALVAAASPGLADPDAIAQSTGRSSRATGSGREDRKIATRLCRAAHRRGAVWVMLGPHDAADPAGDRERPGVVEAVRMGP